MSKPLPRFRTRTLMIAVATCGACVGLMQAIGYSQAFALVVAVTTTAGAVADLARRGTGMIGGALSGASILTVWMTWGWATDPNFESEGLGLIGTVLCVGLPVGALAGSFVGLVAFCVFWVTGCLSAEAFRRRVS